MDEAKVQSQLEVPTSQLDTQVGYLDKGKISST